METAFHKTRPVSATPVDHLLNFLVRGRVFGAIALVSVCALWQSPVLLTAILMILSGVVLVGRKNKQDLIIFLICGLAGASAEIFVVAYGAWSYSAPQLLGIPSWLPLVWGLSALFIRNVEQRLTAHQPFRS
jgi:uncharacterized membrane protein YoaT (DUF817 family)